MEPTARNTKSLDRLLYQDYRRYRATGARSFFSVALTQGFWASVVFRISHCACVHSQIRVLRELVNGACVLLQKIVEVLTGISIPAGCMIGAGLYIGHFGGIFVDAGCRVGTNCNLAQGVTIGQGGRADQRGVPMLGNRVYVGANATIVGKIEIGDDAVIGPGAVVLHSVPPRGIVMGNPARLVGVYGSFDLVTYDTMEQDPERRLALEQRDTAANSIEEK